MTTGISRKTLWNEAAKAGLILGIATIACVELNGLMPKIISSGVLLGVVNVLLWIVKFAGCIYLMRYFMKKLVTDYPDANNTSTRRFGEAVALLSAFLYAAFVLVDGLYINPDAITESLDAALSSYSSMLTSEQADMLQNINFPVLSFFSTLIYCALYGTILSTILSRNIPERKSIFDEGTDNDPDEQ